MPFDELELLICKRIKMHGYIDIYIYVKSGEDTTTPPAETSLTHTDLEIPDLHVGSPPISINSSLNLINLLNGKIIQNINFFYS